MQILLNHEEMMEIVQDNLQGAVEAHVRGQISIAEGQDLTVSITNNGGLFGAQVTIQGTRGAVTNDTKIVIKTPVKRQAKVVLPPVTTVGSFDAMPAPEAEVVLAQIEEVLANGTGQMAGRGISDTPEDRQDPKEMTAEALAELPKVTTTKPVSIFAAKAQQVAPVVAPVEDEQPVTEAMGEAPAPEPVRKSIFSFPKSA